jgi:hypothetical protein
MTTNVQSVVTPVVVAPISKANGKSKLKASTAPKPSPAINGITREQAIATAFEYGQSMAGLDGTLTKALIAYKQDETVLAEMLKALSVGYIMRNHAVPQAEAERIVGLLKYNEKKLDDQHRTFEQERTMIAVRVLWSRAKKAAGFPKTEAMAKAEVTRAAKESERKAHEQRLIKADEIVNPKNDADPFDALSALVTTMKHVQKKYADKLTGERGSAWREWLAKAPK